MTNRQFYAVLAAYTGSLVLAGLLLPTVVKADEIEDAALAAAQEYACEWSAPVSLDRVLATGIPEDIAVEIVADMAWTIVLTTPPDLICPGPVRLAER